MADKLFRILSLDGGGAKGFYTLGALYEIERLCGGRLCEKFDLIYGTSTGSIIGTLLALGHSVEEIHSLYDKHILKLVGKKTSHGKSNALQELADEIFGKFSVDDIKTGIGIVATRWVLETPMIFKVNISQAHGRKASFAPFFGVSISEAVQASCSAYPFFKRKFVRTESNENVELIDGGYCANNPTLYAIIDAIRALEVPAHQIRVVSIGVGKYPPVRKGILNPISWINRLPNVRLLQKTLEINTQSIEQLREVLFKKIETIRISESYSEPDMATNLFEQDKKKLNVLWQRGKNSFAKHETKLHEYLVEE